MTDSTPPHISVISPAYNEAEGIGQTLAELTQEARLHAAEIIVVDDGSCDGTSEQVAAFERVRQIQHRKNRGYGSAITSGIRASSGHYVIWFDADGQHRTEDLLTVVDRLMNSNLDYCIGVRDERSYDVASRKLGKLVLRYAVRFAAGQPVRDFNSGLRGFRRDVILPYLHLLPKGFGASTTTTLLMLERGYYGEEVPIIVRPRVGQSSVKQIRDGLRTLLIILRLILLFKPLVFFGGIGVALILVGSVYGFYEALRIRAGFPVFAALIIILGVQALFFGLLNDQISTMRRERFEGPERYD